MHFTKPSREDSGCEPCIEFKKKTPVNFQTLNCWNVQLELISVLSSWLTVIMPNNLFDNLNYWINPHSFCKPIMYTENDGDFVLRTREIVVKAPLAGKGFEYNTV